MCIYFLLTTALISAAAGSLHIRQSNSCQTAFTQCRNQGLSVDKCQCDLATCSGEDSARVRDLCAAASASTNGTSSTSSATPSASSGTIQVALGQECASDSQCPTGVQCYNLPPLTPTAPTAVPRCGGFNARCTDDSQCSLNTCFSGICNGYRSTLNKTTSSSSPSTSSTTGIPVDATSSPVTASSATSFATPDVSAADATTTTTTTTSSSSALPATTSTGPAGPVTSVVTYAAAALGEPCQVDAQCPAGVQCLNSASSGASAASICGGFNATCSADAQCALNTCNSGLCNGVKPSGGATTTITTAATAATTRTTMTGSASSTASPSVVASTGGAASSREGFAGAMMLVVGAAMALL
ncbi:hypothetical protein CAC42_2203 [Sphaceloma murrayae]|uniref:Uncharacterized protein n=1 Tax=Sphaceloma murrayae TaxID=2082308 RepID=A0A2K1QII7_9PEZI|nr:hypothetical protein CAC42_2203 [Sphaceloma murrayae]